MLFDDRLLNVDPTQLIFCQVTIFDSFLCNDVIQEDDTHEYIHEEESTQIDHGEIIVEYPEPVLENGPVNRIVAIFESVD